MIYSYLNTLMDKWVEWTEGFLTEGVSKGKDDLNSILESTGSDNPTRANELYNIGVLSLPLTGNKEVFDKLRNNENVISDFGFIAYLIQKKYQKIGVFTEDYKALAAICSIQQYIEVDGIKISLVTLMDFLLEHFPIPNNVDEKAYLRYLSAAMFCELYIKDDDLLRYFRNGEKPHLRLVEHKTYVELAKFEKPDDIKEAIDQNISLSNIVYVKGSVFFIGNQRKVLPRGFYYLGYSSFRDFYKDYATIERKKFGQFKHDLYDKETSKNIILELKSILEERGTIKNYIDMVEKLKSGCFEALEILNWKEKSEAKGGFKNFNKIYYGAPGTGKSYQINQIIENVPEDQIERVIFHPEYDYNSFVGSYKPGMEINGKTGEKNITYQFTPESFTKIYVEAWKNIDTAKEYYLIIEEINRGNCAEIFGDIFQLLDRNPNYKVSPSTDLHDYLYENLTSKGYKGLEEGKMVLPSNLYIFATMNTSDQSLFPMDSAFKRRWDWEYVRINCEEFTVVGGNEEKNESYSYQVILEDDQTSFRWIEFIEKVNQKIRRNPVLGMDKCLGNYFIKAEDNTISLDDFIHKAIFYLWNDVFKDEEEDTIFTEMNYESFFPIKTNGKKMVEKILMDLEIKTKQLNLSEDSN